MLPTLLVWYAAKPRRTTCSLTEATHTSRNRLVVVQKWRAEEWKEAVRCVLTQKLELTDEDTTCVQRCGSRAAKVPRRRRPAPCAFGALASATRPPLKRAPSPAPSQASRQRRGEAPRCGRQRQYLRGCCGAACACGRACGLHAVRCQRARYAAAAAPAPKRRRRLRGKQAPPRLRRAERARARFLEAAAYAARPPI